MTNNLEIFLESYAKGEELDIVLKHERKPMGFWREWSNIENVLRDLTQTLGYFPSKTDFSKLGYSSVATAIQQYHGGMNRVRDKLNIESNRVNAGHWSNIDNVKKAIVDLEERLGHFPTISEISKNGLSGMVRAITKEHGGYGKIRELMGKEVVQKPAGYWQEWENVASVLLELKNSLGHFPSEIDLRKSDYSTIANAIREHHGGMRGVRKKMGEEIVKKPDRYWEHWDNVKTELSKAIKQVGKFPTHQQLIECGMSALSTAIRDYHGGFRNVKQKLGRIDEDKYGRYKSEEAVLEKLNEIWNEHPELQGQLPSNYWLRNNGYNYLGQSITAHHGGYQAFRTKLGKINERKPDGHWSELENVKIVLEDLEKKLGHFPSPSEIRKAGYNGMYSAIAKKHRGLRAVKEKMNVKQRMKERGYWKSFDNVIYELQNVIEEFGEIPKISVLRKSGYSGLINAVITYHRGFTKIKDRILTDLGIESANSQLENLLDSYAGGNNGN